MEDKNPWWQSTRFVTVLAGMLSIIIPVTNWIDNRAESRRELMIEHNKFLYDIGRKYLADSSNTLEDLETQKKRLKQLKFINTIGKRKGFDKWIDTEIVEVQETLDSFRLERKTVKQDFVTTEEDYLNLLDKQDQVSFLIQSQDVIANNSYVKDSLTAILNEYKIKQKSLEMTLENRQKELERLNVEIGSQEFTSPDNIGVIWIGDRLKNGTWANIRLRNRDGTRVSGLDNIEIDSTYYLTASASLREEMPENNSAYYKGVKRIGILYRGAEVQVRGEPEAYERQTKTQYWVQIARK